MSEVREADAELDARRGLLTTGDMARLSNSTLRTVRFYEETGLLHPTERAEGGHRLFPQSELDKLRLAAELRLAGLSLDEIKHLFTLKQGATSGATAAATIDAVLEQYAGRIHDRMALLQRLAMELESVRSLANRCRACTDNHLFPESCGECRTMKDAGALPPAATVLWGLKR
ncbi:MAG: MerR family transcriptional regulator [Polyangiaceae bacterium]